MLRFDTVLFDLDGTIIDSVDLIVDSYIHTFRRHGLPPMARDEILSGIGTPLRSVFGRMTSDEAEIAAWIATYREFNLEHHDDRIHAYDGTVDMVRRVAMAGCRLGLVTSKNHAGAVRGLTLVGLESAFEVIIGADDVTRPKPDPEPVIAALHRLDGTHARTIFAGDSHHDINAGRAAGVATAGVTWGPFDRAYLELAAPDFFCATPGELLEVIGVS